MKKMKRLVSLVLALAMVMTMVLGMGVTASADTSDYTITIENSELDATYAAYKVFDATYATTKSGEEIVSYTIKSTDAWYGLVSGTTTVTKTDTSTTPATTTTLESPFTLIETTTSGTYNVSVKNGKSDSDVAEWFNAITADQLTAVGITAAVSQKATGSSLVLDVGEPGYYYITTTTGATVTVTTAAPKATAYDKNSTPGGVDKKASDTTVQIGDKVTYEITASVAAYSGDTPITNFTFTDVLSDGLIAPAENEITVKILDASGNVWTYLSGDSYADYISVDASANTITITFDPTALLKADIAATGDTLSSETSYPTFATIYISYTATVDADAAYANSNTVTETWTGGGTGSKDEETVYTYGFNLWKVIENTTSGYTYTTDDLLAGAEFELTDSNEDKIGFIKSTDSSGNVTYTVSKDTTATGYTTTIIVGSALIFGLDAGTYTLTETKAPDGYNLLTNTVEVTVGSDGYYDTTTGINTNTTIVENSAGTALPGTGGIGTTIFYIIGGILVAGAAVLLITRRRMRRV